MAARDFFLPETRKRVASAIGEIEEQTAAEIVVAVRRRSGHYRHVDVAAGAVLAFAALLAIVYLPQELSTEKIPLDVAAAFAIGFFATANITTLRRVLVSRRLVNASVLTTARAAFYEMGVSRTRGRTGVLVFVSIFERRVEVVQDVGVVGDALGAEWRTAVAALADAVRAQNVERFLVALKSLAPPLAGALPVQPGDVDELPNEPVCD